MDRKSQSNPQAWWGKERSPRLERLPLYQHLPPTSSKALHASIPPGDPPTTAAPTSFVSRMRLLATLIVLSVLCTYAVSLPGTSATGPSSQDYVAPSTFPVGAFRGYYEPPGDYRKEPRPKIQDAASGKPFPPTLDQPFPLPTEPPAEDAVLPSPTSPATDPEALYNTLMANLSATLNNTQSDRCERCVQGLRIGQTLARSAPKLVPRALQELCTKFNVSSTSSGLSQQESCRRTYTAANLGGSYAQVLSYADFTSAGSTDGQYLCSYVVKGSPCSKPKPRTFDESFLDEWFGGKQRLAALTKRQAEQTASIATGPSLSKRGNDVPDTHQDGLLRLLHLSDFHVDPRFFIGGEGACTSGQCCRSDSFNSSVSSGPPLPAGSLPATSNLTEAATYWGNYKCDSPWPLALSAMQAVKHLNGGREVDFTVNTGDITTHDSTWHLSRDLVRYTEQAVFDSMRRFLGKGPVFSAVGNHDTAPSDFASPDSIPGDTRGQFSYDWNNLARLFEAQGWFTHKEAKQVGRHYGGYSVSPRKGLRIITLNTDFWYKGNIYNFINTTDPDVSGTLRWVTDELFAAEGREERVWIVGHVLSGWDGTNPLPNPTSLFYEIVTRFSPRTLAHIFLGHTHEDQFNLFYDSKSPSASVPGPQRSTRDVKAVSFMGPSITPGSNVNTAFRIYKVDPKTYSVMDYDEWYTNVDDFAGLPETHHGPVWKHLYSAREAYGNFSSSVAAGSYVAPVNLVANSVWPTSAPLNASVSLGPDVWQRGSPELTPALLHSNKFWASVTDEMLARPSLIDAFRTRQGRNSPRTKPFPSDEARQAQVCYMRSGSSVTGQMCPQGYGSVQS
ncbi:hypothetical protein IE81DRAFT_326447 [Ceraceosorus guamensis]|uniref:Calcineurin-like phosphoesterase domain-containing protein n=1 Tax=Ceraceosorus guamensis TaxID=1522189 RepID=A0A316VR34_9BASI|nr:hypothetical protein IE81DRAFT_326447 [Ceraceosorus guamensis]PWN39508.1 hypothetical protein IE81DRAFT_326447 [Ceraceosorus guamensis]